MSPLEIPSFGLPEMDLPVFLATITKTLLGFVGFIFVVQIMWSGFLIMTSGGYEEKHIKAVGSLKAAIVGVIIIVSANSLASFVITTVGNATGLALQ